MLCARKRIENFCFPKHCLRAFPLSLRRFFLWCVWNECAKGNWKMGTDIAVATRLNMTINRYIYRTALSARYRTNRHRSFWRQSGTRDIFIVQRNIYGSARTIVLSNWLTNENIESITTFLLIDCALPCWSHRDDVRRWKQSANITCNSISSIWISVPCMSTAHVKFHIDYLV